MGTSRRVVAILAVAWLTFVAAVYVPDVGRGFVKDDFDWVLAGERAKNEPLSILTADATGTFYRPLVTLSFAFDYAVHHLRPRGYGFTNLALYVACVIVLVFLFRGLGLGVVGAATGAFVWAINPHGIDMAVLWLSGRTSLLMTLCSSVSVLAFLHRRPLLGTTLFACALLAKEDAIALPFVVAACLVARRRSWREVAGAVGAMAAAIAGYVALRSQTAAITVATAPSYYQLTWDPLLILSNSLQYLDRGATAATIIALGTMLLYRARPALTAEQQRLLSAAVVWFVAGLLITVRVPVRSSLYIVFSSIGSALACAVAVEAVRLKVVRPSHDLILPFALAALVLVLVPVYKVRNTRWVAPARVSSQVLQVLVAQMDTLPDYGTLVLEDEPVRFSNLTDAFGGAATKAVRLHTGRPLDVTIVPAGLPTVGDDEIARFRLSRGQVSRVN